MTWSRAFSTYTTASPEAVWKRHTTPADWAVDDPMTDAASFPVPPKTGDEGTVTSRGRTQRFVFTEVREPEVMTQVFPLPGARLVLGHDMTPERGGRLRVTHSVTLEGPLSRLLVPFVGWPLIRSRPTVVHGTLDRALEEAE
jgi:hypothetical protein